MIIAGKGKFVCNGETVDILTDLAVAIKAVEDTLAEKKGRKKAKEFMNVVIEDYRTGVNDNRKPEKERVLSSLETAAIIFVDRIFE